MVDHHVVPAVVIGHAQLVQELVSGLADHHGREELSAWSKRRRKMRRY